jgi:hypothetical protein
MAKIDRNSPQQASLHKCGRSRAAGERAQELIVSAIMLSDTDEKSAASPIFSPRTPHNHRLYITLVCGEPHDERDLIRQGVKSGLAGQGPRDRGAFGVQRRRRAV